MKTAIEEARDRLRIAYKYYPASFREGFIDCLLIFERHYATPTQQYAEEIKSPMPQNEKEEPKNTPPFSRNTPPSEPSAITEADAIRILERDMGIVVMFEGMAIKKPDVAKLSKQAITALKPYLNLKE